MSRDAAVLNEGQNKQTIPKGPPKILNGEKIKFSKISAFIYSPPGMGKTTILGTLPGKTLILDVDRGTVVLGGKKNVDVIRMSEDLSELKQTLLWLQSFGENIPYDNVCIDTITELETSMLTVYGRNGKNDGAPELGHYNQAQFKILDYCHQFRALPANVVFTAWEMQKEIIDKSGEKYTQAKPSLSGQGSDKVCGLCDIVGRVIVSSKNGEHYITFNGTPEVIAKDRLWGRKFCRFDELFTPNVSKKTSNKKEDENAQENGERIGE